MSLTDEQLAQIRERYEALRPSFPMAGGPRLPEHRDIALRATEDVPALLAEVERLRAEPAGAEAERDWANARLAEVQGAVFRLHAESDGTGICQLDHETWPCSTVRAVSQAVLSAAGPADAADEPSRQCGSLLRDPGQPLTLWRCVQDAGHDGAHWSRSRSHEWTDAEQYDPNADDDPAEAPEPYALWLGSCKEHRDTHWQWACSLCPAIRCGWPDPLTADAARDEAERHIAARHPKTVARRWNDAYPVGTRVRYWRGERSGPGAVGATSAPAQVLGGHTAVVWIDGTSGAIALTHVEALADAPEVA